MSQQPTNDKQKLLDLLDKIADSELTPISELSDSDSKSYEYGKEGGFIITSNGFGEALSKLPNKTKHHPKQKKI